MLRFDSWIRISNAAGFTIDWLLKDYEPVDSFGVDKRTDSWGSETSTSK